MNLNFNLAAAKAGPVFVFENSGSTRMTQKKIMKNPIKKLNRTTLKKFNYKHNKTQKKTLENFKLIF